jgi:hypothetical protein
MKECEESVPVADMEIDETCYLLLFIIGSD